MKNFKKIFSTLLLSSLVAFGMSSCDPDENTPEPGTNNPENPDEVIQTPYTSIPNELVGTWYADHNAKPLTVNWEQGTFQGEQGFREFRTMVFTKDGKNAIEYTSEIFNMGDEVKQYLFKRVGTLEYKTNPNSLTFHVQSGKVRYFSNKFTGYKESDMVLKDWPTYFSVLLNPQASSYASATNYLTAKRTDGANQYSVRYIKVDNNNPGGGTTDPDDLYANPPANGTYVKIENKYYPTVTIGNLEWMSVNYAGAGGMNNSEKPHYGTFYRSMDLKDIPVPAGWRIPTKQDYIKLLQSQGLKLNDWESTDGEDLQSKKLLGQLMATKGWLKQDGYANNKSGFNAVPANYMAQNASPNGEGANCFLWTSSQDENENPVAFKIIQLPSDTYAAFSAFPVGYYPPHLPLRLVRNK
ncbi:hypothetical protein HUW51_04550 [Adhaeribacter swui]|uniref:Fibrobacter succinogenes major paralogous domain-containing protein n=1 Tax=Adhaeribacter swui TaxID=2086471 RepID=A0A7G7G4E7_9BACT|nr:FISUMP domain-containing protein [Adhaeribacter swui]QNF32031.1 hypothetical protein HUW51_04550 [Adhaeribacter swui]